MQSGGRTTTTGILGGLVIGGVNGTAAQLPIDGTGDGSVLPDGGAVEEPIEGPADAFDMAAPAPARHSEAAMLEVRVRSLAETPKLFQVVRGNQQPADVVTLRKGADEDAVTAPETFEARTLDDDQAWESLLESFGAADRT